MRVCSSWVSLCWVEWEKDEDGDHDGLTMFRVLMMPKTGGGGKGQVCLWYGFFAYNAVYGTCSEMASMIYGP